MKITGSTRLYAIVGNPITQVRSPETFSARFAQMSVDAVLVPAQIPVERFDTVVPALLALGNLDGLLVTVPHKARMAAFASRLGVTAQTIGAINALRREADGSWTGDMFDGLGFVRGAERKGERVRGRRVTLFGAGGAGSAIACALADAGAQSIDVVDVDASKASNLVEKLKRAFPRCAASATSGMRRDADMVVNASPVGMRPEDGLPADIGALRPGTLVGDVVIMPMPTPFIRHAMRYGCPWVDGHDMHHGQLDALIEFFSPAWREERVAST